VPFWTGKNNPYNILYKKPVFLDFCNYYLGCSYLSVSRETLIFINLGNPVCARENVSCK